MLEMTARSDAILIADDDEGVRVLLSDLFEDAGYSVLVVDRGDSALAVARRQRPRAAVVDVEMPGRSGYEVCHRLRADLGGRIVIVLVSGVCLEPYDRMAGLLLGADDFVTKPFDPRELLARVGRLLARVPRELDTHGLTHRELQVLALLATGHEQHEISERLVITKRTAGAHIQHILEKLRVHSRAEAVGAAHRYGLVTAQDETQQVRNAN
jgi:DNA-binding response OmpR family regulator